MAREVKSAVIANGASLATALEIGDGLLAGIEMPAAWTAAALTFKASDDGVDFYDVYDDEGTELSVTVAASRFVLFTSPVKLLAARYLQVRSGTTGTPVNQGAERTIKLIVVD